MGKLLKATVIAGPDYATARFSKTDHGFVADPDGPHFIFAYADSEIRGFWYPVTRLQVTRLAMGSPLLTTSEEHALRSAAVDSFIGKSQMPTSPRKIEELRLHDVEETTILWDGWFRNAASLGSFGLFIFSSMLLTRRAYRALRTPAGHCPHCRYDLRGLPDGSPCPECGREPRTSSTARPPPQQG